MSPKSILALLTPIVAVLGLLIFFPICVIASVLTNSGNPTHRIGRVWAKIILRTSGSKIEVNGWEHIPVGMPVVFACNHASQLDIPILYEALPIQFRFVVKKELFRIPVLGILIQRAGYIPVDRSGGRAALRSMQKTAEKVRKGTSVVIFSEGTRSPDGRLRSFKTGGMLIAIKAGCPVVPVAISGSHKVLPKGSLRVRPGLITVDIGPAVETTSAGKRLSKNVVTEQVWNEISSMLDEENRPARDH